MALMNLLEQINLNDDVVKQLDTQAHNGEIWIKYQFKTKVDYITLTFLKKLLSEKKVEMMPNGQDWKWLNTATVKPTF